MVWPHSWRQRAGKPQTAATLCPGFDIGNRRQRASAKIALNYKYLYKIKRPPSATKWAGRAVLDDRRSGRRARSVRLAAQEGRDVELIGFRRIMHRRRLPAVLVKSLGRRPLGIFGYRLRP